ncbi:DUF3099 domain-containing protein [Streptomyces sp. HNM0645]|uniref:DUF3099 domain-containing protein n=1 Tax=Streptomyces sp. HNM0645 TaxID=2782343 RepID=UPI0024B822BE|nr:DUF3099 domain-containing protein [Streptomyces sp. HNM0645]MDI9887950.1 DUF3099 domain-containing protein [Streptomyces sp. HNM0645]
MRKHKETEVFRITGARQGLAEDVRGRQRRYVISMSVRTLAVVLAAVLWNVERHVAVVALVLGAVLPYIAVVIANAGRESAPKPLATFVPAPTRPALESGAPAPRPAPEDAAHPRRAAWTEQAEGDAECRAEDAPARESRRG